MQAWKSALIERAEEVVKRARAGGADVAEAVLRQGSHLSAKVRAKAPELVSEADSAALGLRVMRGQQVAVAHSSDLSPHGLETLVADALELASLTEPDPHAGPPAPEALARDLSGAEMCAREEALALFDDPTAQLDGDVCLQQALQAETAAYDFDPRITHSEGATFARISGAMALVTSGGFAGAGRGTYASLVVQPVATDASGVRRTGHHWSAKRHCQDLQSPSAVGQEAARRTVAILGQILDA
ncbi:MAG: PmbA/TldA family metallopeptidase, partial [Polyangiales bacterium]